MSWEPSHLHITRGETRLCGEKNKTWPDKFMSNEYASKLPLCPECVGLLKEEPKQSVRKTVPILKPKKVIRKETLFLVDYRLSHIKEQQ